MSDADNTTEPTQVEAAETPVEEQQAEETLGDPGKKALAAERDARKAAERRFAEAEARLKEIEDANLSELQKAQRDAEEYRAKLASLQVENARSRVALE